MGTCNYMHKLAHIYKSMKEMANEKMFIHIYTVKNNPVICNNMDEYTRFHDLRNKKSTAWPLIVEYNRVDLIAVESGMEAMQDFRREGRGMKLHRKLVCGCKVTSR